MKNIVNICLLLSTIFGFSQNQLPYKKVYAYDAEIKGLAMVKTITNTFGFIDKNQKEIIPTKFSKIYKFETKKNDVKYALVKNVAGAYGFIDENGAEIVKDIYWKKEDAIQQLNHFIDGI